MAYGGLVWGKTLKKILKQIVKKVSEYDRKPVLDKIGA